MRPSVGFYMMSLKSSHITRFVAIVECALATRSPSSADGLREVVSRTEGVLGDATVPSEFPQAVREFLRTGLLACWDAAGGVLEEDIAGVRASAWRDWVATVDRRSDGLNRLPWAALRSRLELTLAHTPTSGLEHGSADAVAAEGARGQSATTSHCAKFPAAESLVLDVTAAAVAAVGQSETSVDGTSDDSETEEEFAEGDLADPPVSAEDTEEWFDLVDGEEDDGGSGDWHWGG